MEGMEMERTGIDAVKMYRTTKVVIITEEGW